MMVGLFYFIQLYIFVNCTIHQTEPKLKMKSSAKSKADMQQQFLPLEEIIFIVAFFSAFSLLNLPYAKIDGNPVPTVVFKDRPSFFHAFLLSLNFAFSGAVTTISLRGRHPNIARYSRRLAVGSAATAIGILAWLGLPSGAIGFMEVCRRALF
ncbi:hypothetical protein NMG60_11009661 [Bertholletia excelsa]